MNETINQLEREIVEMRTLMAYYENRILRKQIAIEEIVQSTIAKQESSDPRLNGHTVRTRVKADKSVRAMVEEVLADGVSQDRTAIRKACLVRYPAHAKRIRAGMWQACNELRIDGKKAPHLNGEN